MTVADSKDWSTSYFKDRVDPSDGDFRLVEMRLPHDARGQLSYGPFEYTGIHARERIRRFCAAYLSVLGDITAREAEKILRKSRVVDEKISGAS
jgi:hypothetical protein